MHAMTLLAPAITARDLSRNDAPAQAGGAAKGAPNLILRLEAAAVMAASLAAYAREGEGWLLFAVLFLVPDLSMLGYLGGRKLGAAAYNAAHSYLIPAALGAAGLVLSQPILVAIALIWVAHIGFDRMLGYGLKYEIAFGHTHLGTRGKAAG
jgi:hypothetical protein